MRAPHPFSVHYNFEKRRWYDFLLGLLFSILMPIIISLSLIFIYLFSSQTLIGASRSVAVGASASISLPASIVGISQVTSTGSTVTVPVPAGVQNGDLLLLSTQSRLRQYSSGATGFTVLSNITSGSYRWVGWKVASAEPASYVLTMSNTAATGGAHLGTMIAIRGVDTVTPIDASRSYIIPGDHTTTQKLPSPVPEFTKCLVVSYIDAAWSTSSPITVGLPQGMVSLWGTPLTNNYVGQAASVQQLLGSEVLNFGDATLSQTPTDAHALTVMVRKSDGVRARTKTSIGYSSTRQTFTIPAGVTTAIMELSGAQGGQPGAVTVSPGKGGFVRARLSVTPGEVLNIYTGGQPSGTAAGSNGGGTGGANTGDGNTFTDGGGGGGATDYRTSINVPDRRIVAGGGGGAGGRWRADTNGLADRAGGGGGGGGRYGGGGGGTVNTSLPAVGGGGTPSAGGVGGDGRFDGTAGTISNGGNGSTLSTANAVTSPYSTGDNGNGGWGGYPNGRDGFTVSVDNGAGGGGGAGYIEAGADLIYTEDGAITGNGSFAIYV